MENIHADIRVKQSVEYISFLMQDPSKVPSWLNVHRSLVPDFVIEDPKVCVYLGHSCWYQLA